MNTHNIVPQYKPATSTNIESGSLLITVSSEHNSKEIYKRLIGYGIPKDDIAFENPDGKEVEMIYLKTNHRGIAESIGLEVHDLPLPFDILKSADGQKYAENQITMLKKSPEVKKYISLECYKTKKAIVADDTHFHQLFIKNNSIEQLSRDLKNMSSGISTGFNIGGKDLIFPGGALSIIAAPSGHGKTTFLINCVLGMLENNPDKHVYIISYEESAAAVLMSCFNTYLELEITAGNNRSSIESFFRNSDSTFIKNDQLMKFQERVKTFFYDLINTGRLKISYPELNVQDLIKAIHFIKDNDPNIGALCIDYMQLLQYENNRAKARHEELKQICLLLKDCAIATGLPIIITAQFNRTVTTEADLSIVNIAEAGDIERAASLIIGLFNRNCMMTRSGNVDRDNKPVPQAEELKVEILKGRHIGQGYWDVYLFNGNQGKISQQESF